MTSPIDPALAHRGRFAPTPSGPLHLGSLVTALASFLEARRNGGRWLLRIDDLDRTRCPAGASDTILRQLEAHQLHWDEAPRYQSRHVAEYEAALGALDRLGLVYACRCTRAMLANSSRAGPDGPVYAGTCSQSALAYDGHALRFRAGRGSVVLHDAWQGAVTRKRESEIGDFIVRRADGVFGYQLACAVDEAAQEITEVVRGADLLSSTLRQRLLADVLAYRIPRYRHLPLLTGSDGRKLSKQNHAPALDDSRAAGNLVAALEALAQRPPEALVRAGASEVLRWALLHWDPSRIRGRSCTASPV